MKMEIIFGFLLLTGCTHVPVQNTESGGLFPYGSYRHKVTVHVAHPKPTTMQMHGALRFTADKITVVGLASIGTTIFRIEEDRHTGEIKKEFYLDVVKQHADRFMEFYQIIREVLLAPKGALDFERQGARFQFRDPDDQDIYRTIHVEHPDVVLDIEVTDYAP